MSQHDYNIADADGATVRADINDVLAAIVSGNAGASAPSTTFAYMAWADTTNGVLKRRNAANSAWVIEGPLAEAYVVSRTSNIILGVSDHAKRFLLTNTFTQTLTAAATLGDGWWVELVNAGTGVITVDPNGSETIDGAATLKLNPGESCVLRCNGTGFSTVGRGLYRGAYGLIDNLTIAASVSSNALTIALKDRNGNDPTAANPIRIPFRSATAANGDFSEIIVASATSITISSGSTLGTTNSTPFRFWIVGFNDGGTFRLGLVNCLKDGVSVMALKDDDLASASAEGGAGGADSAHTIYAAAAVSSKPMRVLGWIEYSSGLATAGTYASAPTKVHILGPGDARPGQTVAEAIALNATRTAGTAAIPADNTVPQNTEGTELVTAGIAVTSAANVLVTNFSGYFSNNTGITNNVVVALFRDSGANAKAVTISVLAVTATATIPLAFAERAGAAGSTTMKIRFGPTSAAGSGVAANGGASANVFGGADYCMLHVREVMA